MHAEQCHFDQIPNDRHPAIIYLNMPNIWPDSYTITIEQNVKGEGYTLKKFNPIKLKMAYLRVLLTLVYM